MGLIQEPAEGQPKREGGRGDESPGGKEEPPQRSTQPEFPSWQVLFCSPGPSRRWQGGREGRERRGGRCCPQGGGMLALTPEQNPPQALLSADKP